MLHWAMGMNDQSQMIDYFQHIAFRVTGATMTALAFMFLFGPLVIRFLRMCQGKGQPIRTDGPPTHLVSKQGTPTMGGLMIMASVTVATLLWSRLNVHYVWYVLLIMLGYGAIGFYDDYMKVSRRSARGISGKVKLLLEFMLALVAISGIVFFAEEGPNMSVAVPMIRDLLIPLGWFFFVFASVVIVGTGNAVNLTDGLDGLAIVPVMISAVSLGLISYVVGHAFFSDQLQITYIEGVNELSVFCGALLGSGLGFLWFNAPPAMIFMGDTGSLSLGGALGTIAVATRHELMLAIIGGLFVLEAVSVIIQVAVFKMTGRRVFRMAPLHHHFEQKGWAEPTVVVRFWILSVVLALIGLFILQLRQVT